MTEKTDTNQNDTSRQSMCRLGNQILRNFISRKNRTLELFRVSEKYDPQLQEIVWGDNPDLHDGPVYN
jgi:hypothetical protein